MSILQIKILCPDSLKEELMAVLTPLEFEGFWDNGDTILAYIDRDQFNHKLFYDTLSAYELENNYSFEELAEINWNEEWEKNFDPVLIDEKLYIRANFHPAGQYPYEIVINPKMSFGTGHHPTTRLSAILMMHLPLKDKTVLDMGCGTGILSILADRMGASYVLGVDNDAWSHENALDNIQGNNSKNVEVKLGSTEASKGKVFDVVISNITKNINLTLLPDLSEMVSKEGYLILSGFLDFDLNEMESKARSLGFETREHLSEQSWQGLCMQKNTL